MLDVGRLVVKISGRDSGKIGVVVDNIDDTYVLIDGQVRRKKCNRLHLEPLNKQIEIKAKASTETVVKELEKLGIKVKKTKPKKVPGQVAEKKQPVKKKKLKKSKK